MDDDAFDHVRYVIRTPRDKTVGIPVTYRLRAVAFAGMAVAVVGGSVSTANWPAWVIFCIFCCVMGCIASLRCATASVEMGEATAFPIRPGETYRIEDPPANRCSDVTVVNFTNADVLHFDGLHINACAGITVDNPWYKVEFYGQMPAGQAPKTDHDWEELLVVGGKLAEVFGFERMDGLRLSANRQPPGP